MKHFATILFALTFYTFPNQIVTLKCYACMGSNCTNVDTFGEVECASTSDDWVCMSIREDETIAKACVINDSNTIKACEDINQRPNSSCYTCNTDLCNRKNMQGVSKCYACTGNCDNPIEQDCPNSIEGYLCRTSEISINAAVLERRGCELNNNDVVELCDVIDKTDVGSCYTCTEDLCNNALPAVTQCYSCDGECYSMNVETCPIAKGVNYMCMTIKNDSGNSTLERRGCYPAVQDILDTCKDSQASGIGSCHVCYRDLCNGF